MKQQQVNPMEFKKTFQKIIQKLRFHGPPPEDDPKQPAEATLVAVEELPPYGEWLPCPGGRYRRVPGSVGSGMFEDEPQERRGNSLTIKRK